MHFPTLDEFNGWKSAFHKWFLDLLPYLFLGFMVEVVAWLKRITEAIKGIEYDIQKTIDPPEKNQPH